MSDPTVELAALIAENPGAAEVMGTAASASIDGIVQVQVGPSVWRCTDLPFKPARAGDTLLISSSNSPAVIRNITREKSPPAAPSNVSVNQALSTVDQRITTFTPIASSGAYDYIVDDDDWTALRAYLRDIAAATRGIAADKNVLQTAVAQAIADLNQLRSDVTGVATNTNQDRTDLMSIGNTVNALQSALRNSGVVQ